MINGKHVLKPEQPDRVSFKVGSSILANNGYFNDDSFDSICRGVHDTMGLGTEAYLFSSGAGLAGFISNKVNRKEYRKMFTQPDGKTFLTPQAENFYYSLVQKFATEGQPLLMDKYYHHFKNYGLKMEPFLVNMDKDGKYAGELVQQMGDCAKMGIVPVINEDDSLVYKGVPYKDRDNDQMAAAVSKLFPVRMLAILSKHQLYDRNPDTYPEDAKKIDLLYGDEITAEMIESSSEVNTYGKGGMGSKLRIMGDLTEHGIQGVIIGCEGCDDLYRKMCGAAGGTYLDGSTIFLPASYRGQNGLKTADMLSAQ